MITVVKISGKQGSGKSTLSKLLGEKVREHYERNDNEKWTFSEEIFAGAIYDMHDFCRRELKTYGIEPKGVKDGPLLQYLGTEWGRKVYGDDVWVTILCNKIKALANVKRSFGVDHMIVAVPDCRFKNELDAWPGALKVRLECAEGVRKSRCSMWRENTTHPSETDLDDCLDRFDLVLDSGMLTAEDIATQVFNAILHRAHQPLTSSI